MVLGKLCPVSGQTVSPDNPNGVPEVHLVAAIFVGKLLQKADRKKDEVL